MDENNIIKIRDLCKTYDLKNCKIPVLHNLNIDFSLGKFYAIMGHSGCGKSTLISIIGLLENLSQGTYFLKGIDTSTLTMDDEANIRMKEIGFVYQDFCLDDYLKALENVMLPMLINKDIAKNQRKKLALSLLNLVDLIDRANHYPKQLSGGEKQRVAIARALANNPNIILADEPTGNLDEESEQKIFKILKQLSKQGKCIIVVSHSNEVKKYADEIYELHDGKLEKVNEDK